MTKLCTNYGSSYTKHKDNSPKIVHKTYTVGRYKIEYDIQEFNFLGNGSYKGLFSYNKDYDSNVKIYEDDILIDSEDGFVHEPCHDIILGGDGLTRETTYVLSPPLSRGTEGHVYDLNSKLIKTVYDAGDAWYVTHRVNDNYYITMGYDMCTHHIYIGICDISILFNMNDTDLNRPYNNARVGIPTDSYNVDSYFAAEVTEEGLIVNRLIKIPTDTITIKGNYDSFHEFLANQDYEQQNLYVVNDFLNDDNKKESLCSNITQCVLQKVYREVKLINYKDVDDFDFCCEQPKLEDMFKLLRINVSEDNINKLNLTINNSLNTKSGSVSIPVEYLKELE